MNNFYRGKNVLVTGHTGFKGSYLTKILVMAGANVTGYSLLPPTNPALFSILELEKEIRSVEGDVRDLERLEKVYRETQPEIVFHLAAQPIVREGYRDPRGTYFTNVMGTVDLLECVRRYGAKSVVNVTTDKVYENPECKGHAFTEDEPLDGFDPYSNSKSCSELVTHSYVRSFFEEAGIAVSTARAGNVIGGGDFAPDRIVPDCVRAMERGEKIVVRNPASTRPYQHVLEPIAFYLTLAARQAQEKGIAGSYNVGPKEGDCVTTGELVSMFCKAWGEGAAWEARESGGPHEAAYLSLSIEKAKRALGFSPKLNIEKAIEWTVAWTKAYHRGEAVSECERQIGEYFHLE